MEDFPCVVCDQNVRRRQEAMECDTCRRWQHRVECTPNMTRAEYNRLCQLPPGEVHWNCRDCSHNTEEIFVEETPENTEIDATVYFHVDDEFDDPNDTMEEINACGNHNVKTEGEVKKKWQDLKKQAKAKESQRSVYMRGTGGGPPPKDLSDVELRPIKIFQNLRGVKIDGIVGGTDTAENVTETCHEIETGINVKCEPENIDAELPIASTSTFSEDSRAAAIDIRVDQDCVFVKPKEDLKRKKKTVDEEQIRREEENLAIKRQTLHVLMGIGTSLQQLVQLKRH